MGHIKNKKKDMPQMKKINWSSLAYEITCECSPDWANKTLNQRIIIKNLLKRQGICTKVRESLEEFLDRLSGKKPGVYLTPRQEDEFIRIIQSFLKSKLKREKVRRRRKRRGRGFKMAS